MIIVSQRIPNNYKKKQMISKEDIFDYELLDQYCVILDTIVMY